MKQTCINLQDQNYEALRKAKEGTGLSQSVIINLALESYFKRGILATIEASLKKDEEDCFCMRSPASQQ